MADTKIEIGLSPEDVIAALKKMGDEVKNLQAVIDDALAKKASQSINDLKDNAEKGTNQITKFFQNMGTRIREDLKTAFDVSSIMAGANFAKQIQEGVKSVFDMERAFDRLNVRMGLSTKQMDDFKRSVGRATASAGVNVQDITPGLMAAASAGVKDPKQMTILASSLARARQIDPSIGGGEAITGSIAEILRRQHIGINGGSYTQTMDAINGATATGNFKNADDAGSHIAALAQYSTTNGMDTRTLAGLATMASKGGGSSQALLNQLLEAGGANGGAGAERINGTLGQAVFKNGKLDPTALAKVNPEQWGSASILGEASGLGGANGGDLKTLIETFRDNMGSFNAVVQGTNETAEQFGKVSQSWAAQVEIFKTNLTNAGREVGDSLVETAQGVLSHNTKGEASGISHLGSALWDNKGTLAGGLGLSAGAALLMGGGVRGLIGGAAASAAGINKVYVTNAAEISGAGGIKDLKSFFKTDAGDFYHPKDMFGRGSQAGIGSRVAAAGSVLAAAAIGYEIGKVLMELFPGLNKGDKIYDMTHDDNKSMNAAEDAQLMKNKKSFDDRNGTSESFEEYKKAVHDGTLSALKAHAADAKPVQYTNPSSVKGRGANP